MFVLMQESVSSHNNPVEFLQYQLKPRTLIIGTDLTRHLNETLSLATHNVLLTMMWAKIWQHKWSNTLQMRPVYSITCRFADSPIRRHPDSSTSRFVDNPIRRQLRVSPSTNRDKKLVENAGLEKSQFVDKIRTHTWSTQSQAFASPMLQFRLMLINLPIEVIREVLIKHHKMCHLFSLMNSASVLRSNFRDSIK